jgi:hypothetical protein
MKIQTILKKHNVTKQDIAAEIEGELPEVSFDNPYPLDYAGERFMIESMMYGNRELLCYCQDEDAPLVYVIDSYGDELILCET